MALVPHTWFGKSGFVCNDSEEELHNGIIPEQALIARTHVQFPSNTPPVDDPSTKLNDNDGP